MRPLHWLAVLVVIVGVCAALSVSAIAGNGKKTEKDIAIGEVPEAARATILREAGDNKIKEVEEVSRDGQVIYYEAEWDADGKEIEIKVAPDGKLLSKEIEDDDDDGDDDDD